MGNEANRQQDPGELALVSGGVKGFAAGVGCFKNHGWSNASKESGTKYKKISRIGCFKLKVEEDVDGNIDMQAVGDETHPLRPPTHLIITVNGIIGSAENWKFVAKQFVKKYPQNVIVHCSRTNCGRMTFDGVDVMGDRLAKEVLSVIQRHEYVKKISFIGHSLGGLVARYAIAKLYKFDPRTESEATIAGLQPVNFITLATPHLGSRAHKQIPLFCGSYALEKAATHFSWFLGRSGKQLFLTDGDKKPPLLVLMTRDTDLKFVSALQSFQRRVAYANVRFDILVGWSTSCLRSPNTLPKAKYLSSDHKYRHIVHLKSEELNRHPKNDSYTSYEEEMLRELTKLRWERVDVKFNGRNYIFLAHNAIQVQNSFLHSKGTDVIQHMVDTFLL